MVGEFICLIAPLYQNSSIFRDSIFSKIESNIESNVVLAVIFFAWSLATVMVILTSIMAMFPDSDSEHYEIVNKKIYHRKGYYNKGGFSEFWPSFQEGADLYFGICLGFSSLLLLMKYIWYPIFWMNDYNLLIKIVSFIIVFVGYIWIYNKYLWSKFDLLFTILGVISSVIFFILLGYLVILFGEGMKI